MQTLIKNIILFVLSFFVATTLSCSSQKEMKPKEMIYFGKTACLGKCPVFDFYVFNDGKVIYKGIKNVSRKGNHTYKISQETLDILKKEISTINFNELKSNNKKRDVPNTIIKIDEKKVIFQSSKKIKKLEDLIHKIISNN